MRKTYKSSFHISCLVWVNRRSSCLSSSRSPAHWALRIFLQRGWVSLCLLNQMAWRSFGRPLASQSGILIALGPSARGPVVAGTMAATIVANLLGDRTIWSALVFAVCNAGEAVIVAGLIERYLGRPSASGGYSTCWDCWEPQIVGTAISGYRRDDRFSLPQFDRTSSFNLAALVYFRRPRHRNGGRRC